jgi:FkbM family methyltransferase
MTLKSLLVQAIPAGVVDRLRARRERAALRRRRQEFYASFLSPGELVYDVGANIGERTEAMLAAGCRVVAVEPQPECCLLLRGLQKKSAALTIVGKACGRAAGRADLRTGGGTDVLASLSTDYMHHVAESGRFADHAWKDVLSVDVVSLDELIGQFGMPSYIKIDVEGFETEVLAGLSDGPRLLSFEFTPELSESMLACLSHCQRLGLREFNISYGESMRFARSEWTSSEHMREIIRALAGDTHLFGDIFVRR